MIHYSNVILAIKIVCIFLAPINFARALIVGSKSAASTQARVTFPSSDTNNLIQGYVSLSQGFILQGSSTTCTFDGYYPVSGNVELRGGVLSLKQDLVLSDTSSGFSGGVLWANNHSIILPEQADALSFPSKNSFFLNSGFGTMIMGDVIYSTDWSFDDQYIAVASDEISSDSELKIGYFDGSTLTTTLSQEFSGLDVNIVRWHPTKRFLAVGRQNGTGVELYIYEHRVYNGTLALISSSEIGGDVRGLAWHPSGSYLIVGTTSNSLEIAVYPVNANGVLGTRSIVNLSSNQDVYSVSFAPGGNQLVAGTTSITTVNISELYLYSFNGSLTLTSSLDTGATVNAVDWSPTGTYIAAGLAVTTNSLRIYDTSTGKIREIIPSRRSPGGVVNSVNWDKTGTYLLAGVTVGSTGKLQVYSFDQQTKLLSLLTEVTSNGRVDGTRWSGSNNYVAYGGRLGTTYTAFVSRVENNLNYPTFFDQATLLLNSNVSLAAPWHFAKTCKINGQGKRLSLSNQGALVVRPGSYLIFEDIELTGLGDGRLQCLTNTASLSFRNSIIHMSNNYSFSQGALLFDGDVVLSGTGTFAYTSRLGSTISSDSTLFLTQGLTFSYAPLRANQSLIFMTDKTSKLYLDGCTLHSTRTGLLLSGGVVVIDDKVTLSSEAKFAPESLRLNSDLDVVVRAGAQVEIFGQIKCF